MFITFEGIEGAGKGTQIKFTQSWCEAQSIEYVSTREPGGTELGKKLRALLLDTASVVVPDAEMFLYLADRAQHVCGVIRPALDAGKVVICDRFADSNIVYQGYGRGLDVEELYSLNQRAVRDVWPDITFLLDLEPEAGLWRARTRNVALGLVETEGRFEAENLQFHTRIRNGFLSWAKRHNQRFYIIDASVDPEGVWKQIRTVLEKLLKERYHVEK